MLILDANILVRAVLGRRVLELIDTYSETAELAAPDAAFRDAWEHVPRVARRRNRNPEALLATLEALGKSIRLVEFHEYAPFEPQARLRMERRDPDDWPILACALAMHCAIWTEDTDFFGVGVATWTTDNVELFFGAATG